MPRRRQAVGQAPQAALQPPGRVAGDREARGPRAVRPEMPALTLTWSSLPAVLDAPRALAVGQSPGTITLRRPLAAHRGARRRWPNLRYAKLATSRSSSPSDPTSWRARPRVARPPRPHLRPEPRPEGPARLARPRLHLEPGRGARAAKWSLEVPVGRARLRPGRIETAAPGRLEADDHPVRPVSRRVPRDVGPDPASAGDPLRARRRLAAPDAQDRGLDRQGQVSRRPRPSRQGLDLPPPRNALRTAGLKAPEASTTTCRRTSSPLDRPTHPLLGWRARSRRSYTGPIEPFASSPIASCHRPGASSCFGSCPIPIPPFATSRDR